MRVALFVLLTACNSGTSSITLGKHTLTPQSVVFTEVAGMPTILVTDMKNYCGELQAWAPETPSCNVLGPAPFAPEGRFFTMRLFSAYADETYEVGNRLDATFSTRVPGTLIDFFSRATAGTVRVEEYEAGKSIAGTYDLTFSREGKRAGTFDAQACDVTHVMEAVRKSRSCFTGDGADAGIDACSRSCMCNGYSASTSCSFNSLAGNWTCLCTGTDWQTSTCVMQARPDCNTETGTCCSLAL